MSILQPISKDSQGEAMPPEVSGTDSSYTCPPNHEKVNFTKGGDDYLSFGAGVLWSEQVWPFFDDLARWRQSAERNRGPLMVTRDGLTFVVSDKGQSAGVGAYQFVVLFRGLRVAIKALDEPRSDKEDNVRVEAKGDSCLLLGGVEGVAEEFSLFIERFGGCVQWTKVTRYDMCVDLPGVGMNEFRRAYEENRYVSRSRAWNVYGSGNDFETIYFGSKKSGNIVARIYDKLLETMGNERKRQMLFHSRWHGCIPETATRVEFQLKREYLREAGVNDLFDLMEYRGGMSRYLTHDWLRLTVDVPDKKHPERVAILTVWEKVRLHFDDWTSDCGVRGRNRENEPVIPERVVRQVSGLTASLMAELYPSEEIDLATACARLRHIVTRLLGTEDFPQRLDRAKSKVYMRGEYKSFEASEVSSGDEA